MGYIYPMAHETLTAEIRKAIEDLEDAHREALAALAEMREDLANAPA